MPPPPGSAHAHASVVALHASWTIVARLTGKLAEKAAGGDVEGMMLHSADYLELFSILVVAWQWLRSAALAAGREDDFYRGKLQAAQYWIATELPRIVQ